MGFITVPPFGLGIVRFRRAVVNPPNDLIFERNSEMLNWLSWNKFYCRVDFADNIIHSLLVEFTIIPIVRAESGRLGSWRMV